MWLKTILICFFLNGMAGLAMAMVNYSGYDDQRLPYLLSYTAAATVLAILTVAVRRKRVPLQDVLMGCPMGFCMMASLVSTLMALMTVDTSRFFPLSTAGSVVLTCALSFVIWKEKLNGVPGYAGIAVGVLAIYLLAT